MWLPVSWMLRNCGIKMSKCFLQAPTWMMRSASECWWWCQHRSWPMGSPTLVTCMLWPVQAVTWLQQETSRRLLVGWNRYRITIYAWWWWVFFIMFTMLKLRIIWTSCVLSSNEVRCLCCFVFWLPVYAGSGNVLHCADQHLLLVITLHPHISKHLTNWYIWRLLSDVTHKSGTLLKSLKINFIILCMIFLTFNFLWNMSQKIPLINIGVD